MLRLQMQQFPSPLHQLTLRLEPQASDESQPNLFRPCTSTSLIGDSRMASLAQPTLLALALLPEDIRSPHFIGLSSLATSGCDTSVGLCSHKLQLIWRPLADGLVTTWEGKSLQLLCMACNIWDLVSLHDGCPVKAVKPNT
jgi:hypothetical protein